MVIHVVKSGETLASIARSYGVPVARLARDNGVADPTRLVVGQTIVVLYHERVHTVRAGEPVASIARQYDTTVNAILRNNPSLDGLPNIFPGQTLVIDYTGEKLNGMYSVNGYLYPFIDEDVYRRTLPYLTYASIFSYGFTFDGELVVPDDSEVVDLALDYGAMPLLVLTTLGADGRFNSGLAERLFSDGELRARVIDRLLEVVREKNYGGVDVDFEYIPGQYREAYVEFVRELGGRLHELGKIVTVALAPKTSDDQPGLLYEGIDYAALGQAADFVLLMTYEYGYTYGPPMAVAPIRPVSEVVRYALTRIPAEKIWLGVPNYGYDWTLPYVRGESRAVTMSNVGAVELAAEVGAEIKFDEDAMSPYFEYTADGKQHVVWFEDARSIDAKLRLAARNRLGGIGYWNVMRYFPQAWLVQNALLDVRRG